MENCLDQADYKTFDEAYHNILATELNNYYKFIKKEKERNSLLNEYINLCSILKPKYITAIDLYLTAIK
ncbi:hypothetical protein FACS1894164_20490 [Spirochaetia bacterium]|nr:hypothetical protein FACS1894164_20490 [Spirochaetia bacterium]